MALDFKSIGKRIKRYRTDKGLSQEELGEIVHISERHIRNVETGEKGPSLEMIVMIANAASFILPYVFLKSELSWYGTFDHILDSGPNYIVSGVFLLLTIIIEMPIVYNVLKSNVQSKRMLQITIIVSNIITTAGVAVIERLITEGHW